MPAQRPSLTGDAMTWTRRKATFFADLGQDVGAEASLEHLPTTGLEMDVAWAAMAHSLVLASAAEAGQARPVARRKACLTQTLFEKAVEEELEESFMQVEEPPSDQLDIEETSWTSRITMPSSRSSHAQIWTPDGPASVSWQRQDARASSRS
ncbi:unnamed protein product [Prorocentrum cordatum]|uniref:Uncharacterized protein n=1 Tax=Prorocentrum cordatum TaxID=2364126 RepID=A0ABN9WDJ4_9DINO|nr:unnamed protein product [Polarella glacialis]